MAFLFAAAVQIAQILERQELQTVNSRFEIRKWLNWAPTSLVKLNLETLLNHHEQFEMPNAWWAWNGTLSWLLKDNHPEIKHKIIIFNNSANILPPKTIAATIENLAKAKVKLIVLNNNASQFSKDDKLLAEIIHKCSSGQYGQSVPILLVSTINKNTSYRSSSGVLKELSKLEPEINTEEKYACNAYFSFDKDQIIRRTFLHWTDSEGNKHKSVVLKALNKLGETVPANAPDLMHIDFACPANSDLYPVYSQNQLISQLPKTSALPNLPGAIIFLSSNIDNFYNTPLSNEGINPMSENEILAHALETVARQTWPKRLQGLAAIIYIALSISLSGFVWIIWKSLQQTKAGTIKAIRLGSIIRPVADLSAFALILCGNYFIACLAFAKFALIVPVFTPSLGLGLGTLAAILWEREREREDAFVGRLKSAQEKLELIEQKYQAELKQQEAEAQSREIMHDRKTRSDFVKRINHDLNAPVSLLNWTISELQETDLNSIQAKEKIARLIKASDKLCELIDQLVQSYDSEDIVENNVYNSSIIDLTSIVNDSVDDQLPLATASKDNIEWIKPKEKLWVKANQLELARIIDNIMRNAIKHNPPKTTIKVKVQGNGKYHIVTIADNGKGIAREHLENIFQAGFQVDPNNHSKGQGLGLDIARTLIQGMGGDIEVTSTLQKGTVFCLKIPKHEAL